MLNKFHSKKAAAVIGDTMTWVIATIIIIIMLIVFIFVSSLFAETKSISKYRAKLISNNFSCCPIENSRENKPKSRQSNIFQRLLR